MQDSYKGKFTWKVVLSYLVLAILTLVVGFFIFSEIKAYLSSETVDANDAKLLKTSSLLTQLYESESLSKLAIQTRTKTNFNAYSAKIDTISAEIDSLKLLTESSNQHKLLDSVQLLLKQKVANSNELRKLKVRNVVNSSLDSALEEFKKLEASLGKITPEALAPNIAELSPKAQSVIRDLATYLNNNVPKDSNDVPNAEKLDSILNTSKALLNQAKLQDSRAQRSLERKEFEIHNNDLMLSQQLRSIIAAFEQELIVNTYNDNFKKQAIFRRSMRLAGLAALLGFIIVGIFTFLINRDFWKIQSYRKRLEKEKKFSESLLKSREQLISTVSHDLRTPLNTITGYSELIENTALTEKQLSYLKNVKSASQYVDSLVNDLLDFSKLEAGKIKIEEVPFVLSELIQETAESLKEMNKKKALELILEIDQRLDVTVLGDPFRIRQIMTNLISNAYKFTDTGFIKVQASIKEGASDGYHTRISIEDSGIGIRQEKQDMIFKEFTQAEKDTEKKYGGYGLGLTISKKLAELLGGTLSLKSKEGKGSTFTLELLLKKASTNKPSSVTNVFLKEEQKLSLLIIDDDTAMLQLLSEVSDAMGMTAQTFSDFEAVKKAVNLKYDVVLTDIQMPGTDGFEVVQELKSGKYPHYHSQPIIAMTGRRDLQSSHYSKSGFSKVLQKPFNKTKLVVVLKELFPFRFYSKSDQKVSKIAQNEQKVFNLSIISSFLDNNEEAIHEVLSTFIKDTKLNLGQLESAIDQSDMELISKVSHKMLPMFRQLKVNTIVPDLEFLEVSSERVVSKEIEKRYTQIQKHSVILLEALASYMTKSPSYID
ncbi:MAG: hybrid sensor histidine kinase/response regulator [Flavobacteriaceae bacterium]